MERTDTPASPPKSLRGNLRLTMNLTKKTILALGLAVAGVSYAQTASTDIKPVGVLGQSYSEVHFGVDDLTHTSKNQYDVGVAANVPVSPLLDLTAGYDYSWLDERGHSNSVNGGATVYTTFKGVKPFASAALGYEWNRGTNYREDKAVWGVAAGVEIPVSVVTITPRIVYTDDFHGSNRSVQQTNYGVEANYWVTKTASVFGDVGYTNVRLSNVDAWTYGVGARFKF